MISSKIFGVGGNASWSRSGDPTGIQIQALESRVLFSVKWVGTTGENPSWANPKNWSPQQEPGDGASIVFPASGASNGFPLNDRPRLLDSIEFDSSYNLSDSTGFSGPSLTVKNGISSTYSNGYTAVLSSIGLGASQTFSVANSHLLDPQLRFVGGISDGGNHYGLTISGGGMVSIGGAPATYTGPTDVLSGTFRVINTSIASDVTLRASGVFSGVGTIQKLTSLGGLIDPGVGVGGAGKITTGDLSIAAGAQVWFDLTGSTITTPYDQIDVVGTVNIDGAVPQIRVSGLSSSTPGHQFTLIQNDGVDPVVGTFAGFPEGKILSNATNSFRLSYVGGTGNDVVLTTLSPTAIAISGSTTPAVYGTPRTINVTVTGASGTPTGTVTLYDNSANTFTQPLDGTGHATFNVSTISAGGHILIPIYNGDSVYAPKSGTPGLNVNDAKDTSNTTIAAIAPTVLFGTSAELKATVAASLGAPAKGKVTFFEGSTNLGFANLDSSGVATLQIGNFAIGHHVISATYAGDVNVLGSATVTAATVDVANNPPTTTGLSDINITDGSAQTTLDLASAFADIETADANLVFTITGNTNPSLVTTTLTGKLLALDYAAGVLGSSNITVRATDANSDFVETTFNVAVSHIPASGTLQFASAEAGVSETAGSIDLVISRSGGSEGIASAHYAVTGGSATTADYTLAAGVISFGDGEVSKSITIALDNDAIDEDDETIVVTLSNPSGVTAIGAVAATTVTIHDNAGPTVGDLWETHRPGHGLAPSPMYNASDPDGDSLTLSIVTPPPNGTATVGKHSAGDYILYEPAPTLYGDDSVVYQVDDGHGHTATGTLHLSTLGAGIVDSAISPGLKDLIAIGGEEDDDIEFYAWKNTKEVKVMIGDGQLGHYPVTGRVLAFGMGGNDTIRARYIKQSAIFSGGDGNDRLIGSGGKDILVGGDGNDRLQGYEKMDLFIGGHGADRIDGGAPDDIAIGGTSAFDALATANQLSLIDISNAWNGAGKRTARQNHIRAGVGQTLAKLDDTTVFADNDVDDLGTITTKNWILGDTPGGVTADLVRGRLAA